MDQGSNENHSPVNNFAPKVTEFCVMWEGQALPHDTKFGNCRDKIVDSRAFLSWSLIHGSSWSGLIKVGPGCVTSPTWREHQSNNPRAVRRRHIPCRHWNHAAKWRHIDGFVEDCSNSSALAMELLQFCAKPSIWAPCINGLVEDCSNSSALATFGVTVVLR